MTWVDTSRDAVSRTTCRMTVTRPDRRRSAAADGTCPPHGAHHLILTYSHDIDLALCRRRPDAMASPQLWADRIRNEMGPIPVAGLRDLGHSAAEISRIACPIGDPSLGKHPQAIAVGVAARLLSERLHKDAAPALAKAIR
jgi:xanthine dehydrogenase accessory factor